MLPVIWLVVKKLFTRIFQLGQKRSSFDKLLYFMCSILGAVWCLRFAVGFFDIVSAESGDAVVLEWYEELLNSFVHALQTFSMDEDYTEYIINGKIMVRGLIGESAVWEVIYGFYASLLNFIAPIVGGAIVFEIIASVFPKLRLFISHCIFWKEKYYFSELNEFSLALAKSMRKDMKNGFFEPIFIFTDTYVDKDKEKPSEMLMDAKAIGAICVSDDLTHVTKNKFGRKYYFLMNEKETVNLRFITRLANKNNCKYLKRAYVFFLATDGVYSRVEQQVYERLEKEYGFVAEERPVFVPIRAYRNLVTDLLSNGIPLYDPLVHKKRKSDEPLKLTLTILGTGDIGREMFLNSYWIGQMLDCEFNINVVSFESEDDFWGRIDRVNPEIHKTVTEYDDSLLINRKGEYSPIYCNVRYYSVDINSSSFVDLFNADRADKSVLNSDYFMVALGSDENNISAANLVRRSVGKYHIEKASGQKTVIAYVVYNSDLADTLNFNRISCFDKGQPDIYMQAIGSLRETYSTKNVFMLDHGDSKQSKVFRFSSRAKKELAKAHLRRSEDDYTYWANMAHAMHIDYKAFSVGKTEYSLFDSKEENFEKYKKERLNARYNYEQFVRGNIDFADDDARKKHIKKLHDLAWLEHRRWCAFTRVYGFRHTDSYKVYIDKNKPGSHKQMEVMLHPCLVESNRNGICADVDEKCNITNMFQWDKYGELDLLDELSKELVEKGYKDSDMKKSDYPLRDFVKD